MSNDSRYLATSTAYWACPASTVSKNVFGKGSYGRRCWLPGPSSAWWCEAASHESDHRPSDHGFGMRGQTLVVAVEAAPAIEPGKGSFYHPASRENLEGALPLVFGRSAVRSGSVA